MDGHPGRNDLMTEEDAVPGRISRRTMLQRMGALAAAAALPAMLPAEALAAPRSAAGLTPIVLFPAFHFTRLQVTVRNQTVSPDCPRSGTFEDWFMNPNPSTTFPEICRDELLTLRYDPNPAKPMPLRFSNQRGVSVDIIWDDMLNSCPCVPSVAVCSLSS